jgi:hypothetical protein
MAADDAIWRDIETVYLARSPDGQYTLTGGDAVSDKASKITVLITGQKPWRIVTDHPMSMPQVIEHIAAVDPQPEHVKEVFRKVGIWYLNNQPLSTGVTMGDLVLEPGDVIAGTPKVQGHPGPCIKCPTCKGAGTTALFTSVIPCLQCGNRKFGRKGSGYVWIPHDWVGFGLLAENPSFEAYRKHYREKYPHVQCSCGAEYIADKVMLDDCLKCREPLAWDIEPTEEIPMVRFVPAFEVEYEGETYPMGPYKIVGGEVHKLHSTAVGKFPEEPDPDPFDTYWVHPHVSSGHAACGFKDTKGEHRWFTESHGRISWGQGVWIADKLASEPNHRELLIFADNFLREQANSCQYDAYLQLHHWPTKGQS